MNKGTIIEFIDKQSIVTAVVLEIKNKRLRLLTQNDREINISLNRVALDAGASVSASLNRDGMLAAIKTCTEKRNDLKASIDLEALWELVHEINDWIDAVTLAEFHFSEAVTPDHVSAIFRAVFENKSYFKFNNDQFFPYTQEQIAIEREKQLEEEKRNTLITSGIEWLKAVQNNQQPEPTPESEKIVDILKSAYLFEKESRHFHTAKQMISGVGMSKTDALFPTLVKTGIFKADENIELLKTGIPVKFSHETLKAANTIALSDTRAQTDPPREDFTALNVMTIDGSATKDFDDALSIEKIGDIYVLGIHIIDVGHFIERDSILDRKAASRASSIYMPDDKIPMLPPQLSEDVCSLVEGTIKPCISLTITLDRFFKVQKHQLHATWINVDKQLTYNEVNEMADSNEDIKTLIKIARKFRAYRVDSGATHISLPEVNLYFDPNNTISLSKTDRESPSRMMVAELMILANWLFAGILARNGLPAMFRSQQEPKKRLFKGESDSLYLNLMQRKQLNRAIISRKPGFHSGLGLDAYVTATSPIRRYYDLITQRQLRSVVGLEKPYTDSEITRIMHMIEIPMGHVMKIQNNRKRYWLIKYLEALKGSKTKGVVLDKRKNSYLVILTDYMLECFIPGDGLTLKPEDSISIVVQHADARKDAISFFMG